ncbi:M15 family metallopeptidase [Microbacterium esteraromaticum]|uniref:M15 family metallopeptidase n=1 Tax=Microbacterium esteraromaticum TaxID=57043 RepID=A0A7D7WHV6_9MICO|nr:hypothetical protein [Microbacterium esteraromaticum]QMU97974.1 M15 family metallopeptidase [Microbacterium esteraromaticum]
MGSTPVIVWIRPGVGFVQSAADSFRRLEARLGREVDVNSTYRDWDKQMSMYLAWQAYVNGTGPKPPHSRAVHPAYSIHCQGRAVDSDDWRTPGFISLAAEYGFIRTAASDPTEQHHFEYIASRDQYQGEDPDMPLNETDQRWLNGLGSSIVQQVVDAVPARVWTKLIQAQDENGRLLTKPDGTAVMWQAGGYLASINARVGGTVADIDEDAIAQHLAPLITANLSALSDTDVQRIAEAAADELKKRL